ncbi:conserved hypothetical protein [Limnobacter sp. 130]|nr:conserved hypothetical protein [Limnobacter sp. 130]
MGEAKRRKLDDPISYGRIPKNGRGLVICPPTQIDIASNTISMSGGLDPQELRVGLLFWDKLAWPSNNLIHVGGNTPDIDFLTSAGILTRPRINILGGQGASIILKTQVEAFNQLEKAQPGTWAISQGHNSLLVNGGGIDGYRSTLVELVKAIPVPYKNVPLAEVLELKLRRHAELIALRVELDSFYSAISNSSDPDFELHRYISRIDTACSELLKATKEWQFPMKISDIKASFEINGTNAILSSSTLAMLSNFATQQTMLTAVGGIVGAALSCVKITGDFVWTGLHNRKSISPYRYIHHVHNDLPWSD